VQLGPSCPFARLVPPVRSEGARHHNCREKRRDIAASHFQTSFGSLRVVYVKIARGGKPSVFALSLYAQHPAL
jgi:hypothetical protein